MRAAALSFAAVAVFGLTGLAQKSDPIDTAKATQRIADQKAEADVARAILEADKLFRSRPDAAIKRLKDTQTTVDLGVGLSNETRKTLTTSIQGKLAGYEGKPAAGANPGVKLDPAGPVVKAKREDVADKYLAEGKAVREGIDLFKRYQDSNQPAAADKVLKDLAAKHPDHPSVIILTRKDNLDQNVKDARLYSDLAQQRNNIAFNSVAKSNIPPSGDIEFPKKEEWDRIKKRQGLNDVKLTDKEKKLIEALDKPVTIIGKDKPLDYLLQEISTAIDQPLLIDERSLKDLDIDLKKIGNLDARGVSARTALRQVLAAQGLTYVIKSETIQVLTVEKARESLTTRVYYLGDVAQGIGPFGGGATWGPFLDFQQTQANVALIMDAIQDSVDPLSWKKRGGPGTITFHFPTMSIIVRASSEVHASLGSKLK